MRLQNLKVEFYTSTEPRFKVALTFIRPHLLFLASIWAAKVTKGEIASGPLQPPAPETEQGSNNPVRANLDCLIQAYGMANERHIVSGNARRHQLHLVTGQQHDACNIRRKGDLLSVMNVTVL